VCTPASTASAVIPTPMETCLSGYRSAGRWPGYPQGRS
jgi:hypothetical protein